jgi:hypothetical protein
MKRRRPLVDATSPMLLYCANLEDENALLVKALELVRDSAAIDPARTKSLVLLSNYARDILSIVDKMRINGAKKPEGGT